MLRKDSEDPRWRKSNTESAEPIRTKLRTDKVLPKCT